MRTILLALALWAGACTWCAAAQGIQEPNVAGAFYPGDPAVLASTVDAYLSSASPGVVPGNIFCLVSPHAGYQYSGRTAAFGYSLVKGKEYTTVVVIGPSHHFPLRGGALYGSGRFKTPLGEVEVDSQAGERLLSRAGGAVKVDPSLFAKEHSIEVQIPFLQRALPASRILPLLIGECTFEECRRIADSIDAAYAGRDDVLVVASTDLYHGYDPAALEASDRRAAAFLETGDAAGLYAALLDGSTQMCGGYGVVTALLLSKKRGHDKGYVLKRTDSAQACPGMPEGSWIVGYLSCAIDQQKGERTMLTTAQKKRLLEIARSSLETYLKTGKKPALEEPDPALREVRGAFVTLSRNGELAGCIGQIEGREPLYLAVRDMAVEAGTRDYRFPHVTAEELKDIGIEVSALTPLRKAASAEEIILGTHGVIVKKGPRLGVFLPQVAMETGWSKEEFLSQLCSHKAGLPADAWKDKGTELFIFSAEVFSEKELR